MRRPRPVLAAIWWLALVGWVAAIIAPGAAAMVAFPRLPELEVAIPATQAYFADDTAGAGRFVAGFVTNPIFVAADSARLVAAMIVWLTVVLAAGRPSGGGRLAGAATLAIGAATVLFAISFLTVSAPLAEALDQWRVAVFDGDHDAAGMAKAAFDPLHERASALMKGELLCVLAAIALSGAASAVPTRPEPTS
jgi:hypothetical protein